MRPGQGGPWRPRRAHPPRLHTQQLRHFRGGRRGWVVAAHRQADRTPRRAEVDVARDDAGRAEPHRVAARDELACERVEQVSIVRGGCATRPAIRNGSSAARTMVSPSGSTAGYAQTQSAGA